MEIHSILSSKDFTSFLLLHHHHSLTKISGKMEFRNNKNGNIQKMRKKITALVVDDDSTNRTIHRRLLQNLGIENQEVRNGKEAIDIHCSGRHFDLILMDMDMPIMNGIEATGQLRAMGIHSIIAGVSTHSMQEKVQEFIEAGLDDYQEKPLTTAKLISILHKINLN